MNLKQHELKPNPGAHKNRKRVGRGDGSGHGSYSGRGQKGQKSRTGGTIRPTFEGGQLPLAKALPTKRGFTNIFKTEYAVVNLEQLVAFPSGGEVTPEALLEAGIVRRKTTEVKVKVLGNGNLDRPLAVTAHKFSQAAKQKIEAAGGSAREI